jgi:hypothetical protein
MRWWRAYAEARNDPKIQGLPSDAFKGWFNLCCLASTRSNGEIESVFDASMAIHTTEPKAAALIALLASKGLLDPVPGGYFKPHNWDKRQYRADVTDSTNYERQRRYRSRHRNGSNAVTEPLLDNGSNGVTEPLVSNDQIQIQTQKQKEDGGGGSARASPNGLISTEACNLADEVMAIAGLDPADRMATPPGWCGAAARVETWLAHWSRETILAGVRAGMAKKRDGPPETPRYFERAIARSHLQLTAPIPKNIDVERAYENAARQPRRRTMLDVADELRAELAEKRAASGSD